VRLRGSESACFSAPVDAGPEDTLLTTTFSFMWPDAPHRVLRSCVDAAEAFQGETVGDFLVGDQHMPVPHLAPPCPGRTTTGTIGAMALYAGAAAEMLKFTEDGDSQRLGVAHEMDVRASEDMLRVGEVLWPGQYKPH